MASRTRSYLLEILETPDRNRLVNFQELVLAQKAALASLLSYYQPPKESSRKGLESYEILVNGSRHKVTSEGKQVALLLSKSMNLDEIQAYEIYWNFQKSKTQTLLLHNDRLLEVRLVNKTDHEELYESVKQFYNQERIATLNLVSAIFRAAQDEDHLYHKTAHEISQYIATQQIDKADFQTQTITLLDQLSTLRMPLEYEISEPLASQWTKQNLLEQKCLLSLMILYHYTFLPSPKNSDQIITMCLKSQFGVHQINRPFFSPLDIKIYEQVCNLHTLLFIEQLNLEQILDRFLKKPQIKKCIIDDPELMLTLHDKIWDSFTNFNIGSQEPKPAGVVAVTWACYVQLLMIILNQYDKCPVDYRELQHSFSQTHEQSKNAQRLFTFGYLQAQFLEYLLKMLDNFSQDSNELAYKCIVKSLLNILLVTQNVVTLPNRQSLVECFSKTFENERELCDVFWCVDFGDDQLRSLLDTLQRSFPIFFIDFMKLLCSVIAGPDSSDYCFQYLCRLESFADYQRNYIQSFEQIGASSVWDYEGGNLIVDALNIKIEPKKGKKAYEVGKNVLLLQFEYSAWHLFLSLLDSFLHSSTPEAEKIGCQYGDLLTTKWILKLMDSVLKHADHLTRQHFIDHLGYCPGLVTYGHSAAEALTSMVGEILNRCSLTVDLEIITSCINIMKNLAHHYPETIWKRLRVLRLLPQGSSSPVFNPGHLQQYVIPTECSKGTYNATIAFLHLVREMVVEAQLYTKLSNQVSDESPELEGVKYDILHCSLVFILSDIFPSYDSWRYEKIYQKFEIGLLIVSVFNAVMEDTTCYYTEERQKHPCNIQKLVIESFVERPSYQLSPLLDILSMGNQTPLEYHQLGRRKEAELIESSILESLLLLRRLLVVLIHEEKLSGLELAILDRTCKLRDGTNAEFIQIVASYIDYQNNGEFAQLATEVLTLLCYLTNQTGRSQTSFVGYFGAEAFTLVSKFVDLVNDESVKAAYSDIVQMSVYNFVTAVIESQPGLGAMFLNGFEAKSISKMTEKVNEIKESSILHPLLKTVLDWKEIKSMKPIVLAAATKLLDTLWQRSKDHHSTLKRLGQNDDLWKALMEIVQERKEVKIEYAADICYFKYAQANSVRILATEAFFVVRESSHVSKEMGLQIIKTLKSVIFSESPFALGNYVHDASLTNQLKATCDEITPCIDLKLFRRLNWNSNFDSEKQFGPNYIFNTELLIRKLNIENNESIQTEAQMIIDEMETVNINWSLTDAQITTLNACAYATKLLTCRMWEPKVSEKDIYVLLKILIDDMNQKSIQSDLKSRYNTILGEMIVSCVANLQKSEELFKVLENLSVSFNVVQFKLGPHGQFSEFEFHTHILSAILIILRKADQNVDQTIKNILPVICSGISLILSEKTKSDDTHENLLLCVLFEIVRVGSVKIWLPVVEKYNVVCLLLDAFTTWAEKGDNYTNNPEHVLQTLLAFGMHSLSSILLVKNGVIACLCNNSFSEKLAEGNVNAYSDQKRNGGHKIWLLMMRLVSKLLDFLNDRGFLEACVGFLRLYQNQIIGAFNVYKESKFTLGLLEELEIITGLFYKSSESSNVGELEIDLMKSLTEQIDNHLKTLALFVFLFKNPNELSSRVLPVTLSEKQENEVKVKKYTKLQNTVKEKMLVIVLHIVSFLRLVSNSENALTQETQPPLLFVPVLTSFHESNSTFLTLFDLLRYLTTLLKLEYDRGKPPSDFVEMLVCGSESTLTLLSSQLLGYDEGDDLIGEIMVEFQGTIQDMNGLFNDAVKSWKQGKILDARDYMLMIGNLFPLNNHK
jgi:hypothetical protein